MTTKVSSAMSAIDTITGDLTVTGAVRHTTNVGSVSKTLALGEHYYLDTGAQTITLPASPVAGDNCTLTVGNFTDTTVTSTDNIMGAADDLVIDKAYLTVTFTYIDATQGWVL